MRTLSLTLLAASTMLIAGVAMAQPAPGAHPGATWRGGPMPRPNMQMRGPNIQMRGPNMQMRGHMQGGNVQMHGGNFQMRGGGNHGFHRWGPHPGRNFRHDRLRRGGFINSFWFAPQFYIGDWGAYGFYAPGEDQRWVRYYDDAYLIDGDGRVMDERYGVNWDEHGQDWDDDDGIPAYRGRHGGDMDDEEDYAYEEHEESRGGHHGGAYGPMMPPPGYGPPPPGTQVYGGGYGYGMYAYPIVIETVTTSGSSGYTEEVVEEYVETRHRRRAHRPRPRCSCAAPAPRPAPRRPAPRPRPRPPAGERG